MGSTRISQAATIHGNKNDKWTTSRSGLRGENRGPGELRDSGPSIATEDLRGNLLHERYGLDFHFVW